MSATFLSLLSWERHSLAVVRNEATVLQRYLLSDFNTLRKNNYRIFFSGFRAHEYSATEFQSNDGTSIRNPPRKSFPHCY
ncbi:uncharacterized protein EKO05_0005383 [Ascochyta rabiei]|uniref:uncharacterized protein n=1 Tax=Didymella rabiei TaxID=5454 RepID=UPI0021FE17BF|nr:uncharacterized protein EKO05_0005383 [Ascochyta rabiei]UPX14912.1 hypothetical protein EKO05_0005383 [Ascochyta rabiei]